MYLIYHFEHPFFERYKITRDPWPWNKDPSKWKQTLKGTMKTLLFNQLVVLPIMIMIGALLQGNDIDTSIETFPTWKTLIP
jgi:hypothetical protein